MKFDYLVKHNGIYYKPGEEVPCGDIPHEVLATPTKTKAEEKVVEPIEEVEVKVDAEPKKYTKTEINRMSTSELRNLANEHGINGNDYVGSELKSMLIEKLVQ